MKVLMFGWEFPPFISGGLGTACYGLTRAMSEIGTEVIFLLPKPVATQYTSHVKLVSSQGLVEAQESQIEEIKNIKIRMVAAGQSVSAYQSPEAYARQVSGQAEGAHAKGGCQVTATQLAALARGEDPAQVMSQTVDPAQASAGTEIPMLDGGVGADYGGDMFTEVNRYAQLATQIALQEDFDVVHAHDWMTYRAGIAVSAMTGKPLVVHVHSTEFDRSGENVNQPIYDIERAGMHYAKQIIVVSYLTKGIVTSRYGIPPEKVHVVYNAIDFNGNQPPEPPTPIRREEKLVLFLGRITMQKGPEYFLAAAKKVLEVMKDVRSVMAGSGDMIYRTIQMAAEMGIGHRVLFTGFLRGRDVERVFKMADLYVMPSVSEPFGIAPLEALSNNVPVIISKQSGVSEVLTHALKVDFWDVDEMANKIVAVLRHAPLKKALQENGLIELRKLSWTDSARACVEVYRAAMAECN